MSAWHGGKGDTSRVTSVAKYSDNYDKIFKKNMSHNKYTSYKLFLDDYRNPKDAKLVDLGKSLLGHTQTLKFHWEVVRSYDAFVDIIKRRGIPEVVSFDNDLNEIHMQAFFTACQIGHYDWNKLSKTGIHCVLFLLDECRRLNIPFPPYYVHSANHFARKLIPEIIDEYQKS